MILELCMVAVLTLVPALELRFSIPYGLYALGNQHWFSVFIVAVCSNIVLGVVLYIILKPVVKQLRKVGFLDTLYLRTVERIHKKIAKYKHVYGTVALMLFIGVPFPGSGVYSGAIAGELLGLSIKEQTMAIIGGVLIAGILVTIAYLSASSALVWML